MRQFWRGKAADENYVDEKTGEAIPSVGSADGTSLSDEKDAGGQTADAGAAENTGEAAGRARCGGEHRRAAGRGRCRQKISRHRLQRQVQQTVRQLPLWQTSKQ